MTRTPSECLKRPSETWFLCGSGVCEIEVRNGDATETARAQTEAWARRVEREAFGLSGVRFLFPCIDRQADFEEECYEAEMKRRAFTLERV